jgi:hypothetical protein
MRKQDELPKRGEVARINYKWPQDEAALRDEGTKTRACTVLEEIQHNGKTIGLRVVPHHGIYRGDQPREEDKPYAIKVAPALQRSLGLLKLDAQGRPLPDQKESWILAHRSNLVHVPNNPSIQRTTDRHGNPSWASGSVPEGLLKLIQEKRTLAIENGDLIDDMLEKHGVPQSEKAKQSAKGSKLALKYAPSSQAARRDQEVRKAAANRKRLNAAGRPAMKQDVR